MSRVITDSELEQAVQALDSQITIRHRQTRSPWPARLYGVPRSGTHVVRAILAMHTTDGPRPSFVAATNPRDADFIIDDLIDSGKTRDRFIESIPFLALYSKPHSKPDLRNWGSIVTLQSGDWVIFPWEKDIEGSASDIVTRLLQFIGEDPTRGGLLETPKRVLSAWQEWTAGYAQNPADVLKTFEDGAEKINELILVKQIPIYSHCEHHMAPFFGVAHVGYIPTGRIVGLSKIPRLVDIFAKRLQVQERLTAQIADALMEHLKPKGVAVVLECRHMCMESRGIQRAGTQTLTSALHGALKDPAARAEFFSLIKE